MDVLDWMGNHDHHPDEDYLERYVMKTCSEQETERIEGHLLVCEQCRTRLYEAEEWVVLMKTALPLGPRRVKTPAWRSAFVQLFSRPVIMAGCVAMAVALCAATVM